MSVRDVSGEWTAHQDKTDVFFDIQQNGGVLTGSAVHIVAQYSSGIIQSGEDPLRIVSTEAHGTVTDEDFLFEISWSDGSHGRYSASFEGDGRLSGVTVDLANPTVQATWISSKQFGMQAEPVPEPERPAKKLGKGPTRPDVVEPLDLSDHLTQEVPRLRPDIPGGSD